MSDPQPSATTDRAKRDAEPELVRKLRRRRERYQRRGLAFRVAWVAVGLLIAAAGLVAIVTPGPAFVLIPIGLAMLSLEFEWAQRLLDYSLEKAVEAKERAESSSRGQKIAGGIGTAAVIAAIIAGIVVYAT